jgi:hypothetical protein
MLRVEGTEPAQLLNHFRRNTLRLAEFRPAVYHAMPHRGKCVMAAAFLNGIDQRAYRRSEIRRLDWPRKGVAFGLTLHTQSGTCLPNPVNSAAQNSAE